MSLNSKSLPKKIIEKIIGLAVIALLVLLAVWWRHDQAATSKDSGKSSSQSQAEQAQPPGFNKKLHSTSDPASLWVVVNKGRILPATYVPPDLVVPSVKNHYGSSSNDSHVRAEVGSALEKMFADASTQNIKLVLYSGYRSYYQQAAVNANFVKTQGQAQTDQSSARAGHSEHQTGWAADLAAASGKCDIDPCFANTPEGQWLAANAYKYGFIIRYQKGKEELTGYEFEPWHVRYVGTSLAAEIYKTGETLEQFFGLPNYSDYPAESIKLSSGSS